MTELDDLAKLNTLREKGIINEAEFEAQKKAILAKGIAADKPMKAKNFSLTEAYVSYWKKSFVWRGRATRAEYWWPVLVNALITFLMGMGTSAAAASSNVLYMAFSIASFFPSLAVLVRRMHDVNKSAWFPFVPVLGAILLGFIAGVTGGVNGVILIGGILILIGWSVAVFIYTLIPGTEGANRYGEPNQG